MAARVASASVDISYPLQRVAAKTYTLSQDLPVKGGDVILKGTRVELVFGGSRGGASTVDVLAPHVGVSGRDYQQHPFKGRLTTLYKYVRGVGKPPGLRVLEKMSEQGVATTPTGYRVEPDGFGADGSPSWLIVLGFI